MLLDFCCCAWDHCLPPRPTRDHALTVTDGLTVGCSIGILVYRGVQGLVTDCNRPDSHQIITPPPRCLTAGMRWCTLKHLHFALFCPRMLFQMSFEISCGLFRGNLSNLSRAAMFFLETCLSLLRTILLLAHFRNTSGKHRLERNSCILMHVYFDSNDYLNY